MPDPCAPVVAGPAAGVLDAIHDPHVGLALWWRPPDPALTPLLQALLHGPEFCREAEDEPAAAVFALLHGLPDGPLADEVHALAILHAALCRTAVVRLRLEHTRAPACPRLHVDAAGLRLLCTEAGRGTEWQDAAGTLRRMPAGQVGVFKGTLWPDAAPRVLHRSPRVADLPPERRGRLLLCIDQPRRH